MNWKNLLYALIMLCCLVTRGICDAPKKAPTPCKSGAEYRQFDFWIGDWNVTASGKPAGTSHVELILDDCVIFENWTGVSGYTGKSFNIYDVNTHQWQQHWVDSSGSAIDFTGKYANNKMEYHSITVDDKGQKTLGRMTFSKLDGGDIRQLWEQSTDDGKTWTVAFDGLYKKK